MPFLSQLQLLFAFLADWWAYVCSPDLEARQ